MTDAFSGPGPLQPGSIFADDFRIERPLSAGGMGAVYVVEQLSTGRQRALKLMLPQLVSDPRLRERFEQEARIGSRIDSEHVVEVVAAGLDRATGTPYIAMELLRGEDLASLLLRGGALPPGEALEIVAQLCHAVGAAHVAGIVHRDLKPENLFIAATRRMGGARMVKVLDFGIAKLVAEAKTAHTAALGTPMWMAPEQTAAGGTVGPQADVWAIGLIVFRVLTGRFFWLAAEREGSTLAQLLRETVMEPIPLASHRAGELGLPPALLPLGFDGWLARSLDRTPGARFADANAQLEALRGFLDPNAPGLERTSLAMPVGPSSVAADALAPTQSDGRVPVAAPLPAPGVQPAGASTTGAVTADDDRGRAPARAIPAEAAAPPPRRRMLGAALLVGGLLGGGAIAGLAFLAVRAPGGAAPAATSSIRAAAAVPEVPEPKPGMNAPTVAPATPEVVPSAAPAVPPAPRAEPSAPREPSAREQYLGAVETLKLGSYKTTMTVSQCARAFHTYERLLPSMKPNGPDDDEIKFAPANARTFAAGCMAKAGDCTQAWAIHQKAWKLDPLLPPASRGLNEQALRAGFEALAPRCVGK